MYITEMDYKLDTDGELMCIIGKGDDERTFYIRQTDMIALASLFNYGLVAIASHTQCE